MIFFRRRRFKEIRLLRYTGHRFVKLAVWYESQDPRKIEEEVRKAYPSGRYRLVGKTKKGEEEVLWDKKFVTDIPKPNHWK